MPNTIIRDVKYITQTHFRPTEQASILGLKILIQNGKNRLHIHIRYDDGIEDFVPVFQPAYYTLGCSDTKIMHEPVEG